MFDEVKPNWVRFPPIIFGLISMIAYTGRRMVDDRFPWTSHFNYGLGI